MDRAVREEEERRAEAKHSSIKDFSAIRDHLDASPCYFIDLAMKPK